MFGFLKNKLKEWVDKTKDKLKPEEIESEDKPEKVEKTKKVEKKEKKGKKGKEEKQKKGKEKGKKVKEKKSEKLETENVKEVLATEEDVKEVLEEKKKVEEIAEEVEKGEISPTEALREIEEVEESKKKDESPKKGFISRIFAKKEKPEVKEETIEEEPKETIQDSSDLSEQEIVPQKSFFERVKQNFIYKITKDDFESLFEDLDMLLLENNVALEVVESIKSILSGKLIGKEIKKEDLEKEIRKELKETLNEILIDPDDPLDIIKMKDEKPFVILFFGINGTGKTTSIAKLASLLKEKKFTVALAAADTFRAASIEQISEHARRLEIPLIKHDYGADPSAVGYDAIKYAKAHGIDVVLIDTAGRMHTKTNLIAEMEKIVRVTKPDLKLFVAESIAGNDATEQAKTFHESIQIDGAILSKADIDEKGGTIISISSVTKKPIFYLGTGQNYPDLKLFNKQEFIDSLGL